MCSSKDLQSLFRVRLCMTWVWGQAVRHILIYTFVFFSVDFHLWIKMLNSHTFADPLTNINKDNPSPLPPTVQKKHEKLCLQHHLEPESVRLWSGLLQPIKVLPMHLSDPITSSAQLSIMTFLASSNSFKPTLSEKWTLECTSARQELLKKTETIFEKHLSDVKSANYRGAVFMTYTAANHQGVKHVFWLYFWGAVRSSTFNEMN